MYEVNRSIAVIKPKQPFLDWLLNLPTDWAQETTLSNLRDDCNSFLIPPVEFKEHARDFLKTAWRTVFEAELADWCEDKSLWPEKMTPNIFQQWFDVEIHSVLNDLEESPLLREAFVPIEIPSGEQDD